MDKKPVEVIGIMLPNYAIYGVEPSPVSAYFCIVQETGIAVRCAVVGEPTKYQHLATGNTLVRFVSTEYRSFGALSYLLIDIELTGTGVVEPWSSKTESS